MTKTSSIIKLSCSPSGGKLTNGKRDFDSCYTNSDLIRLRNKWNARHPESKIVSDVPKNIWTELSNKLKSVCNNESCWLRQSFTSSNIRYELIDSFAPQQPDSWKNKPYTWLSNIDIQQVMKQYEDVYNDFEFIGPSPIDYNTFVYDECVWPELCNFQLHKKLQRGIRKIGIIFNLDTHDEPGSHWVSVYIDMDKLEIYYLDSTKSLQDEIPKEIIEFVDSINEEASAYNFKFEFKFNDKIKHQRSNTECGIYCLYFIIQMVGGHKTWDDFIHKRIPDADMKQFRNIYFNKEKI